DPLLGYIHFTALEVGIIDTKLFQRLRKIKQLGLAHLVFPSLGYSRFEHSLGVLGRLNQIVNKLIENNLRNDPKDDLRTVIDDYLTPLRLAALLHDFGHCLFSHCSERIIEKVEGNDIYPSAKKIQESYTRHFKKEKPIPFAEIFSVTIIGSRKFAEFVKRIDDVSARKSERNLKLCGYFVLGLPSPDDPQTVFLAQLISSGLDSDKIDYMNREQHYSGIKLEIDLDRILSKLQVFDLKYSQLPRNLESIKKIFGEGSTFKVLGFGKGGQFAFEEFCVARLALNVKIYLHQKVRAAESQLSTYLEIISKLPVLQEVHNWLKLPEAVIEYPEVILNEITKDSKTSLYDSVDNIRVDIKNTNFKKIDDRNLYFRAFAFGPINSLSERTIEIENESQNTVTEIENFFSKFKESDLKTSIINEAREISQILNLDIDENLFDKIVIDLPRLINI
ncbi:MAG TPA: HD domain-containing protein, partial [Allocoleopsis sp.]